MGYLFTALLFLAALPAGAVEASTAAPDAEQLSHDMISDVDGWLGRLNDKLQSDVPVTEEDFDSLFGDSFLSGPGDQAETVEKAENSLGERLDRNTQANETYGRWLEKKMPTADFSPRVVPGPRRISVDFRRPSDCRGEPRVRVRRGRIHLDYARAAASGPRAARRRYCVMAVPQDADPARFRVKTRKDGVSVIFERLAKGKKKTEAAK